MLRITSLFLNFTAPIIRFFTDTRDTIINLFISENNEYIITEDDLYIEAEDNNI